MEIPDVPGHSVPLRVPFLKPFALRICAAVLAHAVNHLLFDAVPSNKRFHWLHCEGERTWKETWFSFSFFFLFSFSFFFFFFFIFYLN